MDYDWIEMMNHMQNLRRFCSFNTRRMKYGKIKSAQELELLSRAALSQEELTPLLLSRQMGLSKSAVSRLIERLEEKSLLVQKPNPRDKRSYLLAVTEQGREELEQVYQLYLGPVYKLRRGLGEQEFLTLMQLIHSANEALQEEQIPEK